MVKEELIQKISDCQTDFEKIEILDELKKYDVALAIVKRNVYFI